MSNNFSGFTPETYIFFMELALNNDRVWMEANRARYRAVVQEPLKQMAALLVPHMQRIDPDFNPRLPCIVSRINRDTRYSHDKSPYRDHAWLGFRRERQMLGESLCMYFEISPSSYGYGMGMYSSNPALMRDIRARAAADPEGFRAAVCRPELSRYSIEGNLFKSDRCKELPADLKPYLNRGGLSLCFSSTELSRTLSGDIFDEALAAMNKLAPAYRFMLGMRPTFL